MPEILDELIEKAEREINAGLASGVGQPYWAAARDALDAVKLEKDDLIAYGWETLKAQLGQLAKVPPFEQAIWIREMTAKELIDGMYSGAEELAQDTARRNEVREKVLDLLEKLGTIGARLLLSLL